MLEQFIAGELINRLHTPTHTHTQTQTALPFSERECAYSAPILLNSHSTGHVE